MSNNAPAREPLEGLRRHKLLPANLRKALPPLYATGDDAIAATVLHAAFFCPYNGWHWYVAEFDGSDLCFGYVNMFFPEWGYFSLSELAGLTVGPGVPAVERNLFFRPVRFAGLEP